MAKTVILGCSSLKIYIEEAQKKVQTNFPVIYLNRLYHRDPREMREHILEALAGLDKEVETVLVAMGCCGGSWKDVKVPCRVVIPKIDECVSLLLQTTDQVSPDLKEPGHLYVRDRDPKKENFRSIFERLTRDMDEDGQQRCKEAWQRSYHEIDIIDTGINDCRKPEYIREVQKDADWLGARLAFVDGGTYLLEKLFSGKWDEQFTLLEAGMRLEDTEP